MRVNGVRLSRITSAKTVLLVGSLHILDLHSAEHALVDTLLKILDPLVAPWYASLAISRPKMAIAKAARKGDSPTNPTRKSARRAQRATPLKDFPRLVNLNVY